MLSNYDGIVVGSGPNGFAAAITLQRQGLSVLLVEEKDVLGGGVRSAELTLPGFIHDICSAVYPLGEDSPVFNPWNLQQYGLEYVRSPFAMAHPFEDGNALALSLSLEKTLQELGNDSENYKNIFSPVCNNWHSIRSAFLGPFHLFRPTKARINFALHAISSGERFATNQFKEIETRALFAGMAAHSMLALHKPATASIGIVLNALVHINGWPVVKGGSQKMTDAFTAYFKELGGDIQTGFKVSSLKQLPSSKIILLDVTPLQLLQIASDQFSQLYKWQLTNFHYGPGIFKMDWALSKPVPFTNEKCRKATTVHLGGSFGDIVKSEQLVSQNQTSEKPFVLFVQPGVADSSRAPGDQQTAWAYCHVPNGSKVDMTTLIEEQVERFAPGFRNSILKRNVMNTVQMQEYNANYVGGDINGGTASLDQVFSRPVLRLSPYRTSAKGIYICSSSTPPGGGVHGYPGYYAARRALKDFFKIDLPWL